MAFDRRAAGNIINAADPNQYAEAWEGDALAGEPFQCNQVDDATKYAGDFRNLDAVNGLCARFRNSLNENLLTIVQNLLTLGKNLACAAGVTVDGLDLSIHTHTGAAGHGVQIPTGGIADDAVTTAKIAAGAVGTTDIANDAVTAAKIADGAVRIIGEIMVNAAATLGGGDGRRMVVAAVVYPEWVNCDGGAAVNGITIPEYDGRVIAGAHAGNPVDTTGGAHTVDLSHAHGAAGLSMAAAAQHTHTIPSLVGAVRTAGFEIYTFPDVNPSTRSAGGQAHTMQGATANAGSATQDMRQPTIYQYYFIYVGT